MKKRLLALALCLVLAVSLLPITAAAEEFTVNSVYVAGGFCDWAFSGSYPMHAVDSGVYELTISNADKYYFDGSPVKFAINGEWTHTFGGTFVGSGVTTDAVYNGEDIWILVPYDSANITFRLDLSKFNFSTEQGATFTITITDANHHFDTDWTSDETHHWHKCLNEGCTEVKDKALHFDNNKDHLCDDCKASVHTWHFKSAGNTLTGTCGGANCDIGEVSVTLEADSVTLPKSPFETARLVGWNDFQKVTGAGKEDFVYRYKGPGDERFSDPFYADSSRIKAGQYQVGVTINNLPGNVEDGNVAARANTDGTGNYAFLYTQYTAADPKVTAQTGDSRPIEIMMASALVFSALAAAAFIVDSRRKYSR